MTIFVILDADGEPWGTTTNREWLASETAKAIGGSYEPRDNAEAA